MMSLVNATNEQHTDVHIHQLGFSTLIQMTEHTKTVYRSLQPTSQLLFDSDTGVAVHTHTQFSALEQECIYFSYGLPNPPTTMHADTK